MKPHFADRLLEQIRLRRSPAVVGLDPVLERLPAELQPRYRTLGAAAGALEEFGRVVIDLVANAVPALKINSAFFECLHDAGVAVYHRLIRHAHTRGLLVIGDVKRGDIGSTAKLYARGHLGSSDFEDFDERGMPDAVTVAGYLGAGAVQPFIEQARETGRGLFVLVRPSDPGADEIHEHGAPQPLYRFLADRVQRWGAAPELLGQCGYSCVGAVVAPKDPPSTAALREALPHTLFLVPGYGAQGAGAESCRPCFRADGTGAIVNASRSVIFAYEKPERLEQSAGDWRGCIAQAAREFAADVAPLGPTVTSRATDG